MKNNYIEKKIDLILKNITDTKIEIDKIKKRNNPGTGLAILEQETKIIYYLKKTMEETDVQLEEGLIDYADRINLLKIIKKQLNKFKDWRKNEN